ncbi:MAG: hypothetical protein RLZZ571_1065 [Actinomycetota bacterium]|jgi:hypothetical protein
MPYFHFRHIGFWLLSGLPDIMGTQTIVRLQPFDKLSGSEITKLPLRRKNRYKD